MHRREENNEFGQKLLFDMTGKPSERGLPEDFLEGYQAILKEMQESNERNCTAALAMDLYYRQGLRKKDVAALCRVRAESLRNLLWFKLPQIISIPRYTGYLTRGYALENERSMAQHEALQSRGLHLPGAPEIVPIEWLDLSQAVLQRLRRLGIQTVAELCGRSSQELLSVMNIGHRTLDKIETALSDVGCGLRKDRADDNG